MGTESASLETKVRLQQCAVCEFMEKGFLKASLRSICREAGVTTGALYFFFQDKDDLFVSLVGDVLRQTGTPLLILKLVIIQRMRRFQK